MKDMNQKINMLTREELIKMCNDLLDISMTLVKIVNEIHQVAFEKTLENIKLKTERDW